MQKYLVFVTNSLTFEDQMEAKRIGYSFQYIVQHVDNA